MTPPRNCQGHFVPTTKVNVRFFEEPSHELAWVLGLLASDGNIETGSNRVSLSQSGDHGKSLLLKVKDMIGWDGKLAVLYPTPTPVYRLRFSSPEVREVLLGWGIEPAKTFSQQFVPIEEEFHRSFIRGCIDGDGSVGVYSVGACPRYLIMSLTGTPELVDKVGTIVPTSSHRLRDLRGCREVRWNGQNAFQAARWVFQPSKLPETKKSAIWRNYEREIHNDRPKWYSKYF